MSKLKFKISSKTTNKASSTARWKILIADDDEQIHLVTRIVLKDLEFLNQPIELISTYSGKETLQVMQDIPDINIILLDIMMEKDDAGLNVVQTIREEIKNHCVQIIIRTGQPGLVPEYQVVTHYEVNGYIEKTDLQAHKLKSIIQTSLRSYHELYTAEQNRQNLAALINHSSETIININHKGEIINFNPAASTMFGYNKEDIIGKNISYLLIPPFDQDYLDFIKSYHNASHNTAMREMVAIKKDQSTFPIELSLSAFFFNNAYTFSSIIRDISTRKQQEITLIKNKEKAEEANAVKTKFLSMMNHELRTPLNAIMGFGQLLQANEKLSSYQNTCLKHMLDASHHLLHLIDDLLDLAKIENKELKVDITSVDITTIIEHTLNLCIPLAQKYQIKIINNIPSLPFVDADPLRLTQVFTNILSNAIQYNRPNGTVTLSAQLKNPYLYIHLIDTGLGIDNEKLNKIFQPFQRLHYYCHTISGAGAGLSISKDLMTQMNGKIKVQSNTDPEQSGSTFTISIPLSYSQQ